MFINFIEIGHNHLLKHPLCESFLHLKWLKVSHKGSYFKKSNHGLRAFFMPSQKHIST